jgi:hypothetical protein
MSVFSNVMTMLIPEPGWNVEVEFEELGQMII